MGNVQFLILFANCCLGSPMNDYTFFVVFSMRLVEIFVSLCFFYMFFKKISLSASFIYQENLLNFIVVSVVEVFWFKFVMKVYFKHK